MLGLYKTGWFFTFGQTLTMAPALTFRQPSAAYRDHAISDKSLMYLPRHIRIIEVYQASAVSQEV